MVYLWAAVGLVLLFLGAQLLIGAGSALGARLGLSPIVIGLTIVAFGTSTPELIVSLTGAWRGYGELALGNVLGSNIFNVLFILGVSASLLPLLVHRRLLQYEVPIVLGLTILVYGLTLDGILGDLNGSILVILFIGYTTWLVRGASSEVDTAANQEMIPSTSPTTSWVLSCLFLLGGLGILVFGSRLFTDALSSIAQRFGVPEIVVGLTVVSAGTSLPEVGASLVAATQGKTDLAVGNVVGSNIFNLTGVLGPTILVSKGGLTVTRTVLEYDFVVLVAVSILCLPVFFTGHRISRWEGWLFLAYYGLYTLSLLGTHTVPLLSRSLNGALLFFLLPLTALTLGIGLWRHRLPTPFPREDSG